MSARPTVSTGEAIQRALDAADDMSEAVVIVCRTASDPLSGGIGATVILPIWEPASIGQMVGTKREWQVDTIAAALAGAFGARDVEVRLMGYDVARDDGEPES